MFYQVRASGLSNRVSAITSNIHLAMQEAVTDETVEVVLDSRSILLNITEDFPPDDTNYVNYELHNVKCS